MTGRSPADPATPRDAEASDDAWRCRLSVLAGRYGLVTQPLITTLAAENAPTFQDGEADPAEDAAGRRRATS